MAAPGRVRVTLNQKILVHLLAYAWVEEGRDAPPGTTQQGIAEVLRARRSHVTLALHALRERGLVEDRTTRIAGGRRRKKAYALTPLGYQRAQEARAFLASLPVQLPDEDAEIALARVPERLGRAMDLRDLLPCLRPDGVLDPRGLRTPA